MIELDDVAKDYRVGDRPVHALRGITCRIGRGRFAFIVGPSGSGKSTLLYLLGGLDRPSRGRIRIDGTDLTAIGDAALTEYRRARIGFVFQAFNLIGNLGVLDNVLLPFLPRGIPPRLRGEAEELLRRVGLGDRLDHRPSQLSGGEQQRVAIARALLKHPVLLLADEPTGELDSETGQEVLALLRDLHQGHQTTVVVVTHDRRYITDHDDVLEIRDGQLMGEGLRLEA